MLSNEEEEWVSHINRSSSKLVRDYFNVRVGIKTTCDSVFISDKWHELGDFKPEDLLLKNLISQENISARGATTNDRLKILYPHEVRNGKRRAVNLSDYPRTGEYLLLHEEKLKSREYVIKGGRQWYEIWVPHDPQLWKYPKLVFPDISSNPRFYFDDTGHLVNGNCYWIVGKNEDDADKLLFIQGIANSKLMTKYHDLAFNNKLYSGRRRYITQYVERYPLPDFNTDVAKEIVALVGELNRAKDILEINKLELDLESKISKAYRI